MQDIYRRFAAIWANGEPIRSARELHAVVRAAGLSSEDAVTEEWLRSLSRDWVYGRLDDPFLDERANRIYRKELER